ncbi:hypothetical protein [Flammeovirga kamogawensis]|uniref:Uncharacterized protein n=1 Tax=Flammeovirga kamogawensis TaxID=373891 RepID=A0ABX8H3C8_9BACT|nr:hypothetical protein [Flammeovirga kamogawensis]MBB6460315.1 hypothetical protein [Flammeovirga kamogawensis]QWG10124.1 hypothetical protein KM029_20800 [Flammeovirga kamogawensis]TRX65633.1 hypothetical protein EO216_24235 [Flammeovirga kamogawensis]
MYQLLLFLCFTFSFISVKIEQDVNPKHLTEKSVHKMIGETFRGTKAIRILEMYMGINYKDESEYFYNPTNGSIIIHLEEEIKTLQIIDHKVDTQLAHFQFLIDDNIKIEASYHLTSGLASKIVAHEVDQNTGAFVEMETTTQD